ncbi:hypothetical protein K456DRAFT_156987 [Colletotrichum gloeosporioides 23]|nr:hypothetical protein K456DRAFT_156987 [Colletotrichum gloeosporioides 23]
MGRETAWTRLRVAFAACLWTLGVRDNRGSAGAKGGGGTLKPEGDVEVGEGPLEKGGVREKQRARRESVRRLLRYRVLIMHDEGMIPNAKGAWRTHAFFSSRPLPVLRVRTFCFPSQFTQFSLGGGEKDKKKRDCGLDF